MDNENKFKVTGKQCWVWIDDSTGIDAALFMDTYADACLYMCDVMGEPHDIFTTTKKNDGLYEVCEGDTFLGYIQRFDIYKT